MTENRHATNAQRGGEKLPTNRPELKLSYKGNEVSMAYFLREGMQILSIDGLNDREARGIFQEMLSYPSTKDRRYPWLRLMSTGVYARDMNNLGAQLSPEKKGLQANQVELPGSLEHPHFGLPSQNIKPFV